MDVLHKTTQWIDHNRGTAAGLLLAFIASAALISCRATTNSTLVPGKKVTAQELQLEAVDQQSHFESMLADLERQQKEYNSEVGAYNAKLELAQSDLQRQEELRAQVVQFAGGLVSQVLNGEQVTPSSIAGGVVSLILAGLAGGTYYDNRRKDKVIAEVKASNGSA